MRRLSIEVLHSAAATWTWGVYDLDTRRTLRSGSADTQEEALKRAEEAKRELESQAGID
jgi:hypothetical protein